MCSIIPIPLRIYGWRIFLKNIFSIIIFFVQIPWISVSYISSKIHIIAIIINENTEFKGKLTVQMISMRKTIFNPLLMQTY